MAQKAKKKLKPKKPRNPLAAQLWTQGLKVRPSAKAYSRKAKHPKRDPG